MIRHLASLVLFATLAMLALGSDDTGSKVGSSSPSAQVSGAGAGEAHSSGTVEGVETKRIVGGSRFGCTDRAYFEKIIGYAVQNDKSAFSQAIAAGILAGTCTMFKDGEEVYLADTAIFSGLVKVRRKGQTEEYWTNLEAVK